MRHLETMKSGQTYTGLLILFTRKRLRIQVGNQWQQIWKGNIEERKKNKKNQSSRNKLPHGKLKIE